MELTKGQCVTLSCLSETAGNGSSIETLLKGKETFLLEPAKTPTFLIPQVVNKVLMAAETEQAPNEKLFQISTSWFALWRTLRQQVNVTQKNKLQNKSSQSLGHMSTGFEDTE